MTGIQFRHLDAAGARARRDSIAAVYQDAYAARIASGDPFATPKAFMDRFDSHTGHASFDLVIAHADGEPVGQTWGYPLPPTIASWQDGDIADDELVFALCEIMVRQAWAGQGIAHRLHDELLSDRPERFAELYVRPANADAYRAYLRWGWQKVGQTRPDLPGAPVFDVLMLPLTPGE